MSDLTNQEARLIRDPGPEGELFRAGAQCEARMRNASTVLHRELIEYVRALAEHHPGWSSARIAQTAAHVFADCPVGQDPRLVRLSRVARVELDEMADDRPTTDQEGPL